MLPHNRITYNEVRTQHTEQYTHHTYDTLPYHRITYNDVVLPNLNPNITLARL